jgi:hypothetical protein
MMIGRDCFPVSAITPRSIPNPSRTTAVCRIYLEVHRIPPSAGPLFFQNTVTAIPARIPMTAPPTTGKRCPMIHDGMAIARAVVEYTHSKKIGAKTLFATHYHELTDMEDEFVGIVNYNIAAKKRGDSITFLRKIVRGGTDDSYGIEVAKLAGVPSDVVNRAREILTEIEQDKPVSAVKFVEKSIEPDLFSGISSSKESEACDKLRDTDINTMTPIEAMNLLFELKKILSD